MQVKTRFAPSPTGYLHIGSIRTALYSWLFARHCSGKFVLRIEDTDFVRSTPESIETIISSMNWLNLKWDEGPFFQSERLDRYNSIINEMLALGTAYKCYCSKERLNAIRLDQVAKGKKMRYDGYCRYNKNMHCNHDKPYVVRFANPEKGSVVFKDQIRGYIKFDNKELDDLIIRRADGSPTYNFCVVIDDWDMAITHVIRGEDHINNTPRQINILKTLNAPIPIYAHISVINGNDGKKLSKRHGAVSVLQYRDDGYLPEAILNYLVRLGWSHGNQEIFSREEMIKLFSLCAITKSSSTFNIDKLRWLNHYYINTLPIEYIAKHVQWHIEQTNIDISKGPHLIDVVKMLKSRCKTLKDIVMNCHYLYRDFNEFDVTIINRYLRSIAIHPLKIVRDNLIIIDTWTIENIRNSIQLVVNKSQFSMSTIGMPLRIAIAGVEQTPPLDILLYTIGKSNSIARINKALDFIEQQEHNIDHL